MDSNNLKRTIGFIAATSIGLGAMLGAGIFVFPGLAGGHAGFGAIFSFLIGGLIALAVAVCTAELATAMPKSGGGYFFISRTFGVFSGTLTGISQWIGLIFACAFYLVSFGDYAISILEELNISWNANAKIFSFLFTLFLLIINLFGTKKVGRLQNILVISLAIILVLIFSYGLIDYFGLEDHSISFTEVAPDGIKSIFTTSALIFTSYLGFVQVANIGGEIKKPHKNLPRSLIWSVIIATSLYVFIMLICSITLPQAELGKFGETATIEVARKMIGPWGAIVVVFGGLLAALSSANASMISASRGVFAMSNDKLISKKASKINKRFGTPHVALILVTFPVAVILIKSKIEVFAEVASFLHLIIYAGICLSVVKLRITNPSWYIPTFRVPLAKIIAGLGALSCLLLVFFMQNISIYIGLGVLLFAVGYYFLYVKKLKINLSQPLPPHIDSKIINPNVLVPIDISKEKKDLSSRVLDAIPVSNLLLLGFKETPEQSESEQSEDEFSEEGEDKLERIEQEMEGAEFNFETKLIFGNKIISQIKEVIEEQELEFILTLRPHKDLKQLVIPIHDLSQINSKLSTILYKLHSKKQVKLKVILYTEKDDKSTSENELKQALENELSFVNINLNDFEVAKEKTLSSKESIQNLSEKGDLIIWSEAEDTDREFFLKLILEKESLKITTPIIMILKKDQTELDSG